MCSVCVNYSTKKIACLESYNTIHTKGLANCLLASPHCLPISTQATLPPVYAQATLPAPQKPHHMLIVYYLVPNTCFDPDHPESCLSWLMPWTWLFRMPHDLDSCFEPDNTERHLSWLLPWSSLFCTSPAFGLYSHHRLPCYLHSHWASGKAPGRQPSRISSVTSPPSEALEKTYTAKILPPGESLFGLCHLENSYIFSLSRVHSIPRRRPNTFRNIVYVHPWYSITSWIKSRKIPKQKCILNLSQLLHNHSSKYQLYWLAAVGKPT